MTFPNAVLATLLISFEKLTMLSEYIDLHRDNWPIHLIILNRKIVSNSLNPKGPLTSLDD